ncbi:hypothetical protein C7M61_000341 [Candidozyma pseudohaemuli]|uniref:DNA-directed RNA polymerase n=1 Tax=Candidozyma pseudohaemuli TaxID=418784 RepID=A0A2P7YXJ1_9ASCO|nr:hypothetical protein C7M61_000341 [[Candida] pseudohaemulonii]PSK40693.1 hypothetical protein C7M61_000341 [[Candida] pseudohaemulonii]
MWNYIFGGNKQQKKELPKKAIVELREHIQMLNKKRSHLESQIEDQDKLARKHIATNKALAKNALKRKKGYETNLMKIENQIDSLETQLTAIEGANLNLETMKAMKQGALAMKQIHGEYDVDKVENTMDDIREQVELADEISEAISRPVGGEYVDEDELDEELAALQEEEQESKQKNTPTKTPAQKAPAAEEPELPNFPTVNKNKPEEEDEDEEALKALQAEMGLYFDHVGPGMYSKVKEEDKKQVAWTSSHDPVSRSPFVKDVVHLHSLLDALLASKSFERADNILETLFVLLEQPENIVNPLNKYLEVYAAEESTSIEDVEAYLQKALKRFSIQPNERTYAVLLGKSLSSPEHFDKWLNKAKKNRSLFRNMLNNVDVITVDGLTRIFQDPTLKQLQVPDDLVPVFNEVRNPGDITEEDVVEEVPEYFAKDNVDAPSLKKDGAVELRPVNSFGIKVVRHSLLGLESDGIDLEQFFKDLDSTLGSHVLHNVSGSKINCHEFYKQLKNPEAKEKFNRILDAYNEKRQRDLEVKGLEGARAKWDHEFNTLNQRGEISMNKNLNVQLYKWYSDMLPYIEEEHKLCQNVLNGNIPTLDKNDQEMVDRAFYAPYFVLLSPKTLCLIVIFELLKLNNTGGIADGMRTARAILAVGRAVELEYKCQHLMKTDKKFAQKKGLSSNQLKKLLKRRNIDSSSFDAEWTTTLYAKLGSVLAMPLLQVAKVQVSGTDPATGKPVKGLQHAFHHTYQVSQGMKVGVIKLHKNLIKQLGGKTFQNSVQPSYLPMLSPPRPWTAHNSGGYLYNSTNLVRIKDSAENIAYVKAASDAHDLDEVYKGLNILGETAWTVNSKVLDVISHYWNTGKKFLDIPPVVEDPKFTEPPPPNAEPSVRTEYINKVKSIMSELAGLRSQRCDLNYKLEIARGFVGEKMFFPHSVDFRGRAYPISPHFNHLGGDVTRSLFLFWEGQEVGERGLRWLKIHLANLYGKDKAPLDERVKFAEENMDKIFEAAKDPIANEEWWTKGEKPWQVLGVCFELYEAHKLEDPTKFVSYMPVHQDGTCNGLQHYAALGGDIGGAQQVNLVPADRPQDVYAHVAGLVEKRLEADAEAGDERAIFFKGRIARKVVKQTVMTNVYGVTYVGAVAQIEKQITHMFDNDVTLSDLSKYSRYLTTQVFASMRELFERAHLIQDWLGEAAKRISKSVRVDFEADPKDANKPHHMSSVIWTTPLGLPCVQPYRTDKSRLVKTTLQDIIISDPFAVSQVDARKQQAAFPPNYVHSLDATHMLMTAKACGTDGLSFAAVHDSYWTHARDVDLMNKHIRDQFVEIHQEDSIQKLKDEFERRYKGFLQVMTVPHEHDVAIKVKDVRRKIVQKLGRALTIADELYLEKKRQELLNSENPEEVEQGKNLETTVSVTEGYDLHNAGLTTSPQYSFQFLAPLKFPEVPAKGDLDVKVVRDSQYFFS